MLSDAIYLDKFMRGVVLLLGFAEHWVWQCNETVAAHAGYECADAKCDMDRRRSWIRVYRERIIGSLSGWALLEMSFL